MSEVKVVIDFDPKAKESIQVLGALSSTTQLAFYEIVGAILNTCEKTEEEGIEIPETAYLHISDGEYVLTLGVQEATEG